MSPFGFFQAFRCLWSGEPSLAITPSWYGDHHLSLYVSLIFFLLSVYSIKNDLSYPGKTLGEEIPKPRIKKVVSSAFWFLLVLFIQLEYYFVNLILSITFILFYLRNTLLINQSLNLTTLPVFRLQ
jgi:hypothetical protein